MATTAEWGALEWGAAEWGSIEVGDAPWAANGTLTMNGAAALNVQALLAAAGSMLLNGVAGITTSITMATVAQLQLLGTPDLLVARKAGTLSKCGHPILVDCESWLLELFKK